MLSRTYENICFVSCNLMLTMGLSYMSFIMLRSLLCLHCLEVCYHENFIICQLFICINDNNAIRVVICWRFSYEGVMMLTLQRFCHVMGWLVMIWRWQQRCWWQREWRGWCDYFGIMTWSCADIMMI